MVSDENTPTDWVICCQVYLVSIDLSCSILFTWSDIEVESISCRLPTAWFADTQKGHTMPLYRQLDRQTVRHAIRKARRITRMLQGTMGLEGQGLDKQTLRRMKRETVSDLLVSFR
jgi:hypothetical protein